LRISLQKELHETVLWWYKIKKWIFFDRRSYFFYSQYKWM